MSILRDYQAASIEAAWSAIEPGTNRVAIEMATGLGKTITFAALIDQWLNYGPGTEKLPSPWPGRALVLVHTDELVRQAVNKIALVARSGAWEIGVVKAGQDEVDADIIVASVQTLARPERRERIKDVALIIVDEAHHAVARTYVDILDHFGAEIEAPASYCEVCEHAGQRHLTTPNPISRAIPCIDCRECTGFRRVPPVPTFGFTATLGRSDGRGLGKVWQNLAFSRSLPWAVRKGWLVDLVPFTIKIPGVDAGASDAALDSMLADSIAPEAVVRAWVNHARTDDDFVIDPKSFRSTVLFAPLVRSAQAFADAFNDAGIKAEVVHGALPPAERQAILQRYEDGTTTVVCNAMVLTEGWDSPRTKCVIVARPTQSVPLFVQMVGRGLRPWLSAAAPPREDQRCILLCVAGTTTDLATVADLSDKIDESTDGKSLLAMEDEWDLGKDLDQDEGMAYRGPVRVEQWDALVQRSSKAWKYTQGGIPFLPTAKRGTGYVFVIESGDTSQVWARRRTARSGPALVRRVAAAPDLELAMALAEDVALDMGGDIGALLADKTRPWRKAVPSLEALSAARAVGVPEREIQAILNSKSAGKAGRLSDLIDKMTATGILDPVADRIKQRGARK